MPQETLIGAASPGSRAHAEMPSAPASKVSPLWRAVSRLRAVADAPEHAEGTGRIGTLLNDLLDAAAAMEQQLIDQRVRIDQLESLSITDELTGLLNRRGFHLEIDRALERARRNDERGLLVICDLDQFKAINDSFGHLAGDEVLRAVARSLEACTRRNDSVGRLGGDEFAVLMTDTLPQRAIRLAHKLGDRLNGLVVSWQNVEIPVAASLGAQPYDKDITAEHLHALADQAMYRRKQRVGAGDQGVLSGPGPARIYRLPVSDGRAAVEGGIRL